MYSCVHVSDGLRLTLAEPGPVVVSVTYQENGRERAILKAVPEGVGIFDIPTVARPTSVRVDVMTVKAEGVGSLYVSRPVTNADEILAWYKVQGVPNLVAADDMHVTIVYSKEPIVWSRAGTSYDTLTIPADRYRNMRHLGPSAALALCFFSDFLCRRHFDLMMIGASSDYGEYLIHTTVSYDAAEVLPDFLIPWFGPIRLGAEVFEPIKET